VIIFGALGRCGRGAIEFAARVGMDAQLTKWHALPLINFIAIYIYMSYLY